MSTPVSRSKHDPADGAQFVRVAEHERAAVAFTLDGRPAQALAGDTVLTAILVAQRRVRVSEFGGQPRAGFCLIGACQDCWVRTEAGARVRACSTQIVEGMRILTAVQSAATGDTQ
ncbi:(2Fe-2S)-binding protein [Burkholderia pyrrocinia]|uniref:(2Fe-2S)-binding protein n=1 Tax=Burkholderia pyrrocinia TaxID=60550 RepID=UPI00104EFE4B|nr:(2Fe-2S)-binding protein [Burkholderia pyrrocinia]TDA47001.1 (2Fe-2S)-binding protein [Burkholderia pyrrocinia]UOB58301.1 (2Fe-2S)-binding protein [Burkholderia pyrrocinia]